MADDTGLNGTMGDEMKIKLMKGGREDRVRMDGFTKDEAQRIDAAGLKKAR